MTLFKNKYRNETARLRSWDYSSAGWYFVTICTRHRECFFGEIANGEVHLSEIGLIAKQFWQEIPQHSPSNVHVDHFVVMPNHVHGIVIIEETQPNRTERLSQAGTLRATALQTYSEISPKSGSLGVVVRSYKSAITRWCSLNSHGEFGWQPRFYDHIIRDDLALDNIRHYINNNPAQWEVDRENPANLWM